MTSPAVVSAKFTPVQSICRYCTHLQCTHSRCVHCTHSRCVCVCCTVHTAVLSTAVRTAVQFIQYTVVSVVVAETREYDQTRGEAGTALRLQDFGNQQSCPILLRNNKRLILKNRFIKMKFAKVYR